MRVYERVRSYIRQSGMKQKAIAARAGYSEKQFSELMNGKRPMYADDVERICTALNVPPDTFIYYQNIG